MSEWQRGTIGELAKGYRGVTYSAGQLREFKAHDTVTLLRSNNISGGQLNFGDVQIVSERLVSDDQLLTPGDIAVCMSNGSKALVGKSAQLVAASDERFTVGAFCSVFRPQPSANSRFVAYVFQSSSYRSNLDLALAGTAINNLRNVDVEAFACDIPPDEEQSRIAQILDTLDTAIRETEALIDKLKAVKQGLLHNLLTCGIDANGQLRPPQSEAPQLYKESPLGWIPREWEVQPLSAYTASEITYGIVQAGPHIPDGVPYIRTGDMSGDALVRESMLCTSRRIANSYARSEVKAGEIVMAIRATVGKVLPVPDDLDGANLTQGTARISPNSKTDGAFLLWAIRHSRAQQAIQLEIKGTTFAEITLGALRQVPIAAPIDITEQREIAKRLTAIDGRLWVEQEGLAKRLSEKSGLMDDLLTGRVRVTPLLESVQQAAAQTGA